MLVLLMLSIGSAMVGCGLRYVLQSLLLPDCLPHFAI